MKHALTVLTALLLAPSTVLRAAEIEPQAVRRLESPLDYRFPPPFVLKQDAGSGFITSLRRAGDVAGVEFIRPGAALGTVTLRARIADGTWGEADRNTNGLEVRSEFREVDDILRWEITERRPRSGGNRRPRSPAADAHGLRVGP
jgi:hypothetical protein